MKHERITAAHAPNCACPRCPHLRFTIAAGRFGEALLPVCLAFAGLGAVMIPARAAFALAARALGV